MSTVYLTIPLQLGAVMEGNELPSCNHAESISNHLQLIITSRFGEHRSDPTYGCEIWDLDFELIVSASLWEEKLRKSLLQSITAHEQRLSSPEIVIAITDIQKFNVFKQYTEIKKRVDIHVRGTVRKTGEPFQFHTNMFLSPLSLD